MGRTALLAVLAIVAMSVAALTVASESSRPVAQPTLTWVSCADAAKFECATVDAPLDYHQPRGETIKLALIRRPAPDPSTRVGSLFVNPGGPGVAGTSALPAFFHHGLVPTELVERFDIVSWDPRGVGRSSPVQCFDPEQEKEFFRNLPAGFPVGPGEEATWIGLWKAFAAVCGGRVGKLLEHISTTDSARDLDLLRSAVRDPKLSYIGISYGTLIGATYANLFPG